MENPINTLDLGEENPLSHPPTEEVQQPIEEVQQPIEEVQQPTEEVQLPTEEVQQPIEEVQPPTEEVQQPIEEVQDPTEEVQQPIEEVQQHTEEVQQPIEEVQQPIEEVQEHTEEVQLPTEEVQPPIEEVQDSTEEDASIISESSPPSTPTSEPELNFDVSIEYDDIYAQPSSPVPEKNPIIYDVPKVVFIIPYRDREAHKKQFLEKMHVVLEDHHHSYYKIIFVHQADKRSFNRGATKNLGFMYVKHLYPQNYKKITFVFNDVDTFPLTKHTIPNYETVSGTIRHFYGFTFALGGMFSITGEDFEKINGFPNYWAWGFEDNSIQRRAMKGGVKINRDLFYTFQDKNIIHLNDEATRVVNHSEFDKYLLSVNEGISSIVSVNANPETEDKNKSIIMLNVYHFNTGTEENKRDSFETAILNKPFGKIRNPQIFRLNYTHNSSHY